MSIRLQEPFLPADPQGRCFIAVLAQQTHTIGLFEVLRIQQYVESTVEQILWFRSTRSPLTEWVRPRAALFNDYESTGIRQDQVNLMCGDFLRFNRTGSVQAGQITEATMIKLPYRVNFWEGEQSYVCYTIFPDWRLPWDYTIRCSFRLARLEEPIPVRLAEAVPTPETRVGPRPRRLSADAMCPITWEPLVEAETYWTPCAHAFSVALLRALVSDPRCPLCRAPCNVEDCFRADES